MQDYSSTLRDQVALDSPPEADVRAELARILASTHFQASKRRRAFLRFIVEETLAGRGERLKGFAVAVAVFGRDETFDQQADPVVRLEARRLRRDLDGYYVDAGSHDAVRISIPKGAYVPHFEWHEVARSPSPVSDQELNSHPAERPMSSASGGLNQAPAETIASAPSRKALVGAIAVALVAVATAGWFVSADSNRAAVDDSERSAGLAVLPFEVLSSTENSRFLAGGITQELIGDLMQFPGFRVYTLPVNFENAGAEPSQLGRNLGVAYVVSGSVNANAHEIRVAAQALEAESGRVLWSQSYDRPLIPEALIRVQSDLAGEIAAVVGQPYGVVRSDLDKRLETPAVSSMQSYVCVLRAYSYRRNFARKEFAPVLRCLDDAVRRDPGYSDAWAMLGWLHIDAGRIPYAGYDTEDEYKKALQAANEAVRLAPNSILAIKVVATVEHYLGHFDESERLARKALAINPYDPETLAQLGWRLAVRGKFEEGIPLLQRAIARTVNPPGWYYHLIAIDLYLKGQYEQMLAVVERSAVDGSGFANLLVAVANAELGNREETRKALRTLFGVKPLASDPAGYLRRHGAIDNIVDALVAGLKKAETIAGEPTTAN